jgi:hypothetical protein
MPSHPFNLISQGTKPGTEYAVMQEKRSALYPTPARVVLRTFDLAMVNILCVREDNKPHLLSIETFPSIETFLPFELVLLPRNRAKITLHLFLCIHQLAL